MKIRTVIEFDLREDLADEYAKSGANIIEAVTDELDYMFESAQHGIAEYSCCYVQSVEIIDAD
jgi:hypothetical protein